MANTDPIPTNDAAFDGLQKGVVSGLGTNAVAWGVPAGVNTNLGTLQGVWDTAYAKVRTKGTFTSTDTENKNLAKKALTAALRVALKQWVSNNPVVTNADRISMGLKPKDTVRTRVPAPSTFPELSPEALGGMRVKVFFKQAPDEFGISKRGKPKGATRIEIIYHIGVTAVSTQEECELRILVNKSLLLLTFVSAQVGMKLTGFGRWLNNRNEPGPWSFVRVVIIPG